MNLNRPRPLSRIKQKRLARSYRSPGAPMPRPSATGNFARGGGANNFQYGPAKVHARKSIVTIHAETARPRKEYGTTPDFTAMTRDELREAAKARNVEGWHKMNKAQLLAAVTA